MAKMVNLITDPRLFNYLIITLSALSAVRWAYHGSWSQAGYWTGAVILNVSISSMSK